jgi:hypothetical protein
MSVVRTAASPTMSSLPVVVRSAHRPWERSHVGAVIGIDAVTSLAAGVRVLPTGRGFGGR